MESVSECFNSIVFSASSKYMCLSYTDLMYTYFVSKIEGRLKVQIKADNFMNIFLQYHALCVSKGFLDHCPVSQHLQHITASLEDLLCHHKFMFFKVKKSNN